MMIKQPALAPSPQPRFNFRVVDPMDLVELILFALLAMLASRVVYDFATHP
jgi:hypothetical protein